MANTLIKTSMIRLKRGKTYLFEAMNLLDIMCYISAISDLLQVLKVISYLLVFTLNECGMHVSD